MNRKRKPQELFICKTPFHPVMGERLNATLNLVSGTASPLPTTLQLTLSRGKEKGTFWENLRKKTPL